MFFFLLTVRSQRAMKIDENMLLFSIHSSRKHRGKMNVICLLGNWIKSAALASVHSRIEAHTRAPVMSITCYEVFSLFLLLFLFVRLGYFDFRLCLVPAHTFSACQFACENCTSNSWYFLREIMLNRLKRFKVCLNRTPNGNAITTAEQTMNEMKKKPPELNK